MEGIRILLSDHMCCIPISTRLEFFFENHVNSPTLKTTYNRAQLLLSPIIIEVDEKIGIIAVFILLNKC